MAENKYTQVLDHGLLGLVDSMGGDGSIVRSARVSYGDGTKTSREDASLIRYLMRHSHSTPFEFVQFHLHVRAPIFVARQWMRHRAGTFNEYSLRYSVAMKEFYVPNDDRFTEQSKTNKQGSGDVAVDGDIPFDYALSTFNSRLAYDKMIEAGVNRETSRGVLTVSQYTEFYWSVNLWNLLHFINLRIDEHAQYEIREYARRLLFFAHSVAPVAVGAWLDYHRNAYRMSPHDLDWVLHKTSVYSDSERNLRDLEKVLRGKRDVTKVEEFELTS